MQTLTSSAAATPATGVVVQTALTAGGRYLNHSEAVIRTHGQ